MASHVKVHHEVKSSDVLQQQGGWDLCFQKVTYFPVDEPAMDGFRFMYRGADGNLLAHRGGARLPDIATAKVLMDVAIARGWGEC